MRRYELADEQWELIADLFPPEQGNGRPWRSHRLMVNAMLWILNSGSPWRDLPERYGPWQTARNRFNRWRKDGTSTRFWNGCKCVSTTKVASIGTFGWWTAAMCAPTLRRPVVEKKGAARTRRSRFGPLARRVRDQVHLVADSDGTPLAVHVTPGQTHEVAGFESVVDAVRIPQTLGRPRTRPQRGSSP
jgi:transposase